MRCKKHLGMSIPCPTCMLDEYLYHQKINDDLIRDGKPPKNDLTELENELKRMKLIP